MKLINLVKGERNSKDSNGIAEDYQSFCFAFQLSWEVASFSCAECSARQMYDTDFG